MKAKRFAFIVFLMIIVSVGCTDHDRYHDSAHEALKNMPGGFNANADSLEVHIELPSPIEENQVYLYSMKLDGVTDETNGKCLMVSQVEPNEIGFRRFNTGSLHCDLEKEKSYILSKSIVDGKNVQVATAYYGWADGEYIPVVTWENGTLSQINTDGGYFMGVFLQNSAPLEVKLLSK